MGMEKLGTKGPTFIATITLRTKFSLGLTLKKGSLSILDLEEITRKGEGEKLR